MNNPVVVSVLNDFHVCIHFLYDFHVCIHGLCTTLVLAKTMPLHTIYTRPKTVISATSVLAKTIPLHTVYIREFFVEITVFCRM